MLEENDFESFKMPSLLGRVGAANAKSVGELDDEWGSVMVVASVFVVLVLALK